MKVKEMGEDACNENRFEQEHLIYGKPLRFEFQEWQTVQIPHDATYALSL